MCPVIFDHMIRVWWNLDPPPFFFFLEVAQSGGVRVITRPQGLWEKFPTWVARAHLPRRFSAQLGLVLQLESSFEDTVNNSVKADFKRSSQQQSSSCKIREMSSKSPPFLKDLRHWLRPLGSVLAWSWPCWYICTSFKLLYLGFLSNWAFKNHGHVGLVWQITLLL